MYISSDLATILSELHCHCLSNTALIEYPGSLTSSTVWSTVKAFPSGETLHVSLILLKGDTIVEASSGNTGISFAAIGKKLGHPVKIILPDWLSRERADIIRSLGAEIIKVSQEQGGFIGSINLAEEMAKDDERIFLPRQFSNEHNSEAHETGTAREIWEQLRLKGVTPDAFVAGVGTGGTVMGTAKYFKWQNRSVTVHPLEPAESPTLTKGYKTGKHRIQGISDEFIPALVKLDELDHVIQVHDGDAILAAQKLASQLGLAVGISSGANFLGALQLQNEMGPEARVVTVFCDSNKKYLSTDLMREEPLMPGFLSPGIEFIGYKPIRRLDSRNIVI